LDVLVLRLLPRLKDATVESRLRVFSDLQPGHSGALALGSENPISFSNSFSQSLHWYS
jgi:hypothetical protein